MNIQPTRNYLAVRPIERKLKSGIIIPVKQKGQRARVVAMGKRIVSGGAMDGTVLIPEFKVGDVVIHKRWEGQEVRLSHGGEPLLFVKYKDVLAVEEKCTKLD